VAGTWLRFDVAVVLAPELVSGRHRDPVLVATQAAAGTFEHWGEVRMGGEQSVGVGPA
jgi:hypothetical protein